MSYAFMVLAVELDTGTVFLSDRTGTLGLDRLTPAILSAISASADGCTVDIEAQALPTETIGAFWSNREAALIEVDSSMGSVYDGRIIFDGVIGSEPTEQSGVFGLSITPRQHRVVNLPDAGVIDTVAYPLASGDASGQHKPLIFGTLESCPLLAVRLPPASVLSATAYPGEVSLSVESTDAFDDVGAVWVGDQPIQYTSKTSSTLNGLTVAAELIKGTPVTKAGSTTFMAAAHPVAILSPMANGRAVTDGELNSEGISFPHRPLVTTSGTAMNYLAQFDWVASGANTAEGKITYPVAETITASARAYVEAKAAKTLVTTYAPVASSVVEPASQSTQSQAMPYKVTGWTVRNPVAYSGYQYTLWEVTLAGSVTIAAPVGAEVDVTMNHSDSWFTGFDAPGYWIPTATRLDRVNGTAVLGSTRITSSGSVTITSDITLIIGIHASQPYAAFTVVRTQLERGMSLDAILTGRMMSWTRISSLSTPSISLTWRQSAVTKTVLTQPPPTSVTTPAVIGVSARESASVVTLGNLAVSILPPSSVTAGNYTFSVFVNTQQRGDITNPAPVYTATLGGVAFAVPKAGGSVNVVVPVTPGVPVDLVHTVTHSTDMTATLDTLFNGAPDDLPPGAFPSAIGLIVPQISTVGVTWSNATITNPALNAVNAIRAITATVNQSASGWDTSIASMGKGNIIFARPNTDRIVTSYTTVNYTVNLNGYTGAIGLTIGGQNVYYAEGGNAQYNWSPCTIEGSEDVDLVPVEYSGGHGIITVTINSAGRTVLTGNIDGGKYATLRHPSNTKFRAVQLDQMPPRGRFKKARLFVEWFMGGIKGAAVPDVKVSFGGQQRGSLRLEAPAGSAVNKTVAVNTVTQGSATMLSSSVASALTKTDLSVSSAINMSANYSTAYIQNYTEATVAKTRIWYRPMEIEIQLPLGVVAGQYTVTLLLNTPVDAGFLTPNAIRHRFTVGNVVRDYNSGSLPVDPWFDVTISDGQTSLKIIHDGGPDATVFTPATLANHIASGELYYPLYWVRSDKSYLINSISFLISTQPTKSALTIAGSVTTPSQSLSNTGTAVSLKDNAISVTVPDAPRTTVTEFALAEITDWSQLTGQVCEIEYTAGIATLDINLVQVQIAVDYDDENRIAVGDTDCPVTAGVIGMSGNPADVITYLANVTGQGIDPIATRRLREWCSGKAYVFARRLSDPTDSLTLLTYAAEQANVQLARRGNTIAPVRWFDLASDVMTINEADCLVSAQIGWADRVETAVTLNYLEDITGNSGFMRTLVANNANNLYCKRGLAAIKVDTAVTIEAGWIRDDITAALYLADYTRRFSQPRRTLALDLPHTYSALQEGDLIRFTRLHQGIADSITARITSASSDAGWPSITAEQIND